jgi:hypothetical protein
MIGRRAVGALGIAAVWLATAAGCAAPHGLVRPGLPEPPRDAVAIAIVGGAAGDGPDASATATALRDQLASARASQRDAVVLLPGGWASRNGPPSPVVTQVLAATERVGTRFAITSPSEAPDASAIRPTALALVRIDADGRGQTLSTCAGDTCQIAGGLPGVAELLLVDLGPWWAQDERSPQAVRRLVSLLAAIDRSDPTPRILVLAEPVEGAFERGAGAQTRRHATFHTLPPALREAIAEGLFVGVVAGGERSTHATADLGPVIQRSDRTWLRKPVWQVVSGNASNPVLGRGGRRSLWQRGTLYQPELASFSGGFAVAWIHANRIDLDVVARHRRGWRHGRLSLPLRPATRIEPSVVPHLAPCPRCTDLPASERP